MEHMYKELERMKEMHEKRMHQRDRIIERYMQRLTNEDDDLLDF